MQHNVKKIAFFDFCETIVSIQSADLFIDYVRSQISGKKMNSLEIFRRYLVKFHFFKFLNLFTKKSILIHKKLKLLQLKGKKEAIIDELAYKYYQDLIKPKLNNQITDEIMNKKKLGYRIIIISGGYSIYIKYFAKEYGIDDIISTEIKMKNNICKGSICGIDCMNENKIKKIISHIKNINSYDLKKSYAYSDSITDLPLLKFVGNGVVVNNVHQKWALKNKFEEIILND